MDILKKNATRYVSKLSNKIRRKIDAISSKGNYSGTEGKVLHFLLAQTEDIFQKDIEEEFSLRPPTATELLKRMEQNGLIRREAAEYDARLKRIIASPKAMQYQEQVISDLMGLEKDLSRNISPDDMEAFFRVMEQMLKNLS